MQINDNIIDELLSAGHIYIIGDGGSAAMADHLACDLLKNSNLPAISLCSNSAVLTALANDYAFRYIYSLQLYILYKPQDILIIFSGSGNSDNLVEAAKVAGVRSIVVSGNKGGRLKEFAYIFCDLETNDQYESENYMSNFCHILTSKLSERRTK